MIERLIAEANVAEYERMARQHEEVRLAKKLFPRAVKKHFKREPANPPAPNQPRVDPLYY